MIEMMTREEHERQQSVVREVYDLATGRHRLVRGDGEIIERIVPRRVHEQINRTATRMDGRDFQNSVRKRL